MPIRFRCVYCDKLLGIGRRKAGAVVNCPHCGEKLIVPTPEPGGTDEGPGMPEVAPLPSTEDAAAKLFEDDDFDVMMDPRPIQTIPPPAPPPPPPPSFQPPAPPARPKFRDDGVPPKFPAEQPLFRDPGSLNFRDDALKPKLRDDGVPPKFPEEPNPQSAALPGGSLEFQPRTTPLPRRGIHLSPGKMTLLGFIIIILMAGAFFGGIYVGQRLGPP